LDRHQLAGVLQPGALDGDEGLVETDQLPGAQGPQRQRRGGRHPQPSPGGMDLDLALGDVDGQHGRVAARWAGEGVELLLDRGQLVARALQRLGEPLVLGRQADRLLLQLTQPVRPVPVHPSLGHLGPFPARHVSTVGHAERRRRGGSLGGRLAALRLLTQPLGPLEVAAHPPDLLVRHGSLGQLLGPVLLDRVGTLRRVVPRKPVWPTTRWSGRTASRSRCHPRTRVSHARGSVNRPVSLASSTKRESWVVVATYATSTPPGTSASAATWRFSQGASMSRTTRSTVPGSMAVGSTSARSPTTTSQAGWSAPNQVRAFALAISAKSARRSTDSRRPVGPTAWSSDMLSAPDPTPASTTRAPGKMSASATICAASLG